MSKGCLDCDELHNGYVRVYKFEEKQSDGNLAVQAVHDAALNLADSYAIVKGDSDQVGTILLMRKDFSKQVIVLNPHEANSLELKIAATFYRNISRDLPAKCQLPDELPVGMHGNVIRRPAAWKKVFNHVYLLGANVRSVAIPHRVCSRCGICVGATRFLCRTNDILTL